jgi:ribosomal protein S18 acetylase RimI-like enzyme
MKNEVLSVAEYGLAETAIVLSQGFSDYFVRIPFTAATLMQSARSDGVDLSESRVVLHEGIGVGAVLIARRGWTSRVAGMSLAPSARRKGIGRWATGRVIDESRARGERFMGLEVIEQNEPAVKLYEACGFQRVRRLVGFEFQSDSTTGIELPVSEVDIRQVAALLGGGDVPDLPWQLSGETIAHLTPPFRAFGMNGAWIVVSDVSKPEITIRAIAATGGSMDTRNTRSTELLRAMTAIYSGKKWKMSALLPEELGDIFTRAGFSRTKLTQWQMLRSLS